MKLKSPLLSFSASGSLANLVTFLNIRGRTYAKTKQGPIGGSSAAQLLQRAKFKAACEYSHTLTPEQKAFWHSQDPRSASCSWFNNFMSAFILDPGQFEVSMIESIQHCEITLDGVDVSKTLQIDEVNLNLSVLVFSGYRSNSNVSTRCNCSISFQDSTHVLAKRYNASAPFYVTLSFHVIAFNASAVNSVQYESLLFVVGNTEKYIFIDAVNLNKSVILPAGFYTYSSMYPSQFRVTYEFESSIKVICKRDSSVGQFKCPFFVLEFK